MPRTHIRIRVAVAFGAAIAAVGVAAVAQARTIVDPPSNAKRIQPIKARAAKKSVSTRSDGGFPHRAGVHVRVPAEAKTE